MYIIAPISATTRRIKEVSHITILHDVALYLCPNIVAYVSIGSVSNWVIPQNVLGYECHQCMMTGHERNGTEGYGSIWLSGVSGVVAGGGQDLCI